MYLVSIAKWVCAIILCQFLANNYFSMSEVWGPLSYLLILITVHKAFLWYYNKKEETVSEKNEIGKSVTEKLDCYIYQFGLLIFISMLVEIFSGIYFASDMANTLQHFNEQGLTKAQVFNWRCSGAYSFARSCDQKELEKDFCNERLVGNAVSWAYATEISFNEQTSGIYISCSPGHAKKLKDTIVRCKWDGPSPIHSEEDCKRTKFSKDFDWDFSNREDFMKYSTIKSS